MLWLTMAAAIDVAALAGLWWVSHTQVQRSYRAGWVDGTMGREYGHSFPGKIAYPARHDGQPVADPDGWLPPTPPPPALPPELDAMAAAVREQMDRLEDTTVWAEEPPTLEGTIIIDHRDRLAATAWDITAEQPRLATDSEWTKGMAAQVNARLAMAVNDMAATLASGPAAIESGVGDVYGGGEGAP
jgi:hypothetical protein